MICLKSCLMTNHKEFVHYMVLKRISSSPNLWRILQKQMIMQGFKIMGMTMMMIGSLYPWNQRESKKHLSKRKRNKISQNHSDFLILMSLQLVGVKMEISLQLGMVNETISHGVKTHQLLAFGVFLDEILMQSSQT